MCVLVLAAMWAPAARAATASVSGDTVRYVAAPGEHNGLSVERVSGAGLNVIHLEDPSATIGPGVGCIALEHEAWCFASASKLDAQLGDGNDTLAPATGNVWVGADGGAGDDGLMLGETGGSLTGGSGNDLVEGSPNGDFLVGGHGDDVLAGNGEGDDLDGGTGCGRSPRGRGNRRGQLHASNRRS